MRAVVGEQSGTTYSVSPRLFVGGRNIHKRNRERLEPLSVTVKMGATDGKAYDTRIYGFEGILEVYRFSSQPNAHAVMD